MARETYILRNGELIEKRSGIAFKPDPSKPLATPMVMRDTPDYHSPIDGRLITSRSERREDLKRNGCVEAGDVTLSKGKPEFRNARFAKKYNLPHGDNPA